MEQEYSKIEEGGDQDWERVLPYCPIYLDDDQLYVIHKRLRGAHCNCQSDKEDNSRRSNNMSKHSIIQI